MYVDLSKQWARTQLVRLNDINEFKAVLENVKQTCLNIYFRKRDFYEDICQNAYIEEKDTKYRITYKPGKKAVTFEFDRDGEYLIQLAPKEAVRRMSCAFKIQRTEEIMKIHPDKIESAKPLLYKNDDFDGMAVEAYEYDLSEAYAQMLRLPLPDLKTARYDAKINEGQVGFYAIGPYLYCSFEVGKDCQYVFDLMDSPYCKWLDGIDKKIKKATEKSQVLELKSLYRYAIGDLQNLNPFWRCIVVDRCNQLVMKYVDKNTVYCNTDSIVSITRRLDIENDQEFKWSLKREKEIFKWQRNKMNYQWNLEVPMYKGPYKRAIEYFNKTHDRKWDILVDGIPEQCKHKYTIDKETLKIYEEK